jgi:hypothetical protein
MGTRQTLLEVSTTPEAVALGHLATHLNELAASGELPQDSSSSEPLERLKWSFSSVGRCRWDSRVGDLLFVVHARLLPLLDGGDDRDGR